MTIDHKCKNFKDAVDRLTLLNRLVNDMREQCGEVATSDMLATVRYANMDPTCIGELVYVKINRGDRERVANVHCFQDLREYVIKRQARERILAPRAPVRMDVSAVERAALPSGEVPSYGYAAGAQMQAPWINEEDRHLQPSPYHDPTPGPWTEVPEHAHLDAMRQKGIRKGGERKKMLYHNCSGENHPFRLCTSAYGAKDKPQLPECKNCGGKGHDVANCPSPGGGKHVPKGKGKDNAKGSGKDKGKGKGQSQ